MYEEPVYTPSVLNKLPLHAPVDQGKNSQVLGRLFGAYMLEKYREYWPIPYVIPELLSVMFWLYAGRPRNVESTSSELVSNFLGG
jgi:hypothetical protein